MAKISKAQQILNIKKRCDAEGYDVQSIEMNGKAIRVWFGGKGESYDPATDLDNIDWSKN